MLTYGGIGLLVAGIILTFFGDKIIRDPEQAAKRKKQGPIMALVGALALGLAIVLELSLFCRSSVRALRSAMTSGACR